MKVLTGFKQSVPTLWILMLFSILATGSGSASACTDEVQLFLLAGQSNMVSNNPNTDLPPPMDEPLPAVKIWNDALHKWSDLKGGFGYSSLDFGPEVSFGHRLAEELSGDLRIVKVAAGRSPI